MPSNRSKKSLPYERIETLIERTLDDVRAVRDIAALNECRALFRKKVPLSLRAYVASALLLGAAGFGRLDARTEGKRGERNEGKRGDRRENGERAREPNREGKSRRDAQAGDKIRPDSERRDEQPKVESRIKEGRFDGEEVNLFFSVGRRQHMYARHILRMIADVPEANEDNVGQPRVLDNYSFVTVDPDVAEAIIAVLDGRDVRGRKLAVNRAKKRPQEGSTSARDDVERSQDDADADDDSDETEYGSDEDKN